jgi:hypothetical protein
MAFPQDNISFVKAVAYFITSSLGKLPFVYMMMLLWGGIIIGYQGQAIMFLIYSVVMLVSFGIIRPILASTTSPASTPFLYSLMKGIHTDSSLINQFVSVFMGIPSEYMGEITSKDITWIHKYILVGVPDAMIFPSAFMYGYGITTAENGITDSRNMPMLFTTILGVLLQLNITQMGGVSAFLNVIIGMFVGVLGGSFVADNPDLGPFNTKNQSFNMVVTNVA